MKERLFKKNVLNVKPFFVHVAQVMDVVILHVSFVHVSIYVAMNMFGMYMVHYMLWCQKKPWNVDCIFAACNNYYQERGGWAGAHKIVGV